MTVHEFIRQTRIDLGYTQVALADLLGVSDAAVSRWETGSRTPPTMALRLLEQITGRKYGH